MRRSSPSCLRIPTRNHMPTANPTTTSSVHTNPLRPPLRPATVTATGSKQSAPVTRAAASHDRRVRHRYPSHPKKGPETRPPISFTWFVPKRPRSSTREKCTFSIGLKVIAKYPARADSVTIKPATAARRGRPCVEPNRKGSISQGAESRLTDIDHQPIALTACTVPRYWSPAPNTSPAMTMPGTPYGIVTSRFEPPWKMVDLLNRRTDSIVRRRHHSPVRECGHQHKDGRDGRNSVARLAPDQTSFGSIDVIRRSTGRLG